MDDATIFTNFRPIYIFFIIIQAISLIMAISQKKQLKPINEVAISSVSFICLAVSAFMTYQIGILSDELVIGGDPVSFIMFFVVVIMSVVNFLVIYLNKKN
ncbi:hypothetical protein QJ48_15535 [Paenibacillus sp. A3]|uniref:hypothetical protein n=1 Tax=Paenibacillus sp. A3 TaxID=1337054 RepID=UPI0006D576CE|nr:hypothetical protein [Paenibacillus sp. A3]KPV58561.1 hypothetical protein QJ48_15535 [Paenibacillus sp. A3]